jgi:ATP-binding cassette subfamily F protein 3
MRPIAELVEERVIPFSFPSPTKPQLSPLIRFENAAVGYVAGHPVLQNLHLRLDADDRIGLLGANGNGKSTFAKLMSGRLSPMAGHRRSPKNLIVGYFAQHQIDELPSQKTPYQFMAELMPDSSVAHRRARIAAVGFGVGIADTPAENLSGGEKARLLFALATFHGPHLLILDEPTNHLDVDARKALVRALSDYEGAVILISHDRSLLDACADRLWIVRGGTVRAYEGDLESYRAECLAERGVDHDAAHIKVGSDGTVKRGLHDTRRRAAELRATLAPLKREQAKAEFEIERIAGRIAAIDAALADGGLYARDANGAQKLTRERGTLMRQRLAAESAWIAASEAYELAQAEADELLT